MPEMTNEFLEACKNGNIEAINTKISEEGIDVHWGNECALHTACASNQLDVVKLFVEQYNCNVNSDNGTPLNRAADCGHFEIVEYLLEKGADKSLSNYYPQRIAGERGYKEIIELLRDPEE